MKRLFLFVFFIVFVVALAIPVSAADDTYDFGGLTFSTKVFFEGELIDIRDDDTPYHFIVYKFTGMPGYFLYNFESYTVGANNELKVLNYMSFRYDEENGYWTFYGIGDSTDMRTYGVKWSRYDMIDYEGNTFVVADPYFMSDFCDGSACPATDANRDNLCDDCGLLFAVLRDYTPFTVSKFMNYIGQIFTSAISWVGNVGSTVLQQPLLLAFTALPLCGLGIAVFRRLKNTV